MQKNFHCRFGRVFVILATLLTFGMPSCKTEPGEDDAGLLALTALTSASSLNVTVTYNPTSKTYGTCDPTTVYTCEKKNYVLLFDSNSDALTYRNHVYPGDTGSAYSADSNGGTISVPNIKAGTYYVVAFYDYYGASNSTAPANAENQNDLYGVYAGDGIPAADRLSLGSPVVVNGSASVNVTFTDSYKFKSKGLWNYQ